MNDRAPIRRHLAEIGLAFSLTSLRAKHAALQDHCRAHTATRSDAKIDRSSEFRVEGEDHRQRRHGRQHGDWHACIR